MFDLQEVQTYQVLIGFYKTILKMEETYKCSIWNPEREYMPEKIVIGNKKDLWVFRSEEYEKLKLENKSIIKDPPLEISTLTNEKTSQALLMIIEKIRSNPNYPTFLKNTQEKAVKEDRKEQIEEEFSYLEEEAPFNWIFSCMGSKWKRLSNESSDDDEEMDKGSCWCNIF